MPGSSDDAPLPAWFAPLAQGLVVLTLVLAGAGSWMIFRTPDKKAKSTTKEPVVAQAEPARTESLTPEPAKAEPKKKKAKKEEPRSDAPMATPMTTTPEPKVTPEPKSKTEPKPKTEPEAKPKTEPPKPEPPKPAAETPKTEGITFVQHVLPILRNKCTGCHGADNREAELDVRSVASLIKGGGNGPALKPGNLEQSLIWEMISTDQMPPKNNPKLTPAERKIVQSWIIQGKDIVK